MYYRFLHDNKPTFRTCTALVFALFAPLVEKPDGNYNGMLCSKT